MNIAESIRQIPAFEGIEQSSLEPLLAAGKLLPVHPATEMIRGVGL
jgi:hypothetical protein